MFKAIKSFLMSSTGMNDHCCSVEACPGVSHEDPVRSDFEQVLRLSALSGLSLARESNNDAYRNMATQAAWWSWRLVFHKPYDPVVENYTHEQHHQEFQAAFAKNLFAATVEIDELYAVNDRMEYRIEWVHSAWVMWMQAHRMYQIQ